MYTGREGEGATYFPLQRISDYQIQLVGCDGEDDSEGSAEPLQIGHQFLSRSHCCIQDK